MKKVLSLILALAMVLSVVPFAFAEGEETPASYDLSYAFTLEDEKTFVGGTEGLISDYDGGLTPKRDQRIASGSIADENKADLYALGYWYQSAFYSNANLNRPSVNHFAPADTNNANKETGMTSLAYTYNANIDSASGDYVGDESLYGTLAYNFGAGRIDELAMTSDTGTTSGNGASSLPTIRFKAPKSGYINPVIKLATQDADGLLYRVSKVHLLDPTKKLNSAGWITSGITDAENAIWTTVYPKAGEETYTRVSTNVNTVIAPTDGWAKAPANVMTTRNDALVYVEAGDEINLVFAKTGSDNTKFAIDTIRMDYVDAFTLSAEADYKAGNPVLNVAAVLEQNNFSTDNVSYTVAGTSSALLTETATAGVYTIANTVKNQDVVTVVATYSDLTVTLNITLNTPKTVYDFGELFAVSNTFSGTPGSDYASALTPVTAPGNGDWNVGYAYYANNSTASSTFYKYATLLRSNMYSYAQTDTNNAYKTSHPDDANPALTYSYSTSNTKTADDGGKVTKIAMTAGTTVSSDDVTAGYGTAGYGFGSGKLVPNSSLSGQSARSMTMVVFTAPRTGIVKPVLKLANPNSDANIYYRMYKLSADQSLTADPMVNILPKEGESAFGINISSNTNLKGVVGTAWDGDTWCTVGRSNNFTTRDDALVYVEAGERIVLRFYTTMSYGANFVLDTLKYEYVDRKSLEAEFFFGNEAIDLNAWMEGEGWDTSSAVWSELEDEYDVAQVTADGQLVTKNISPEGSVVRVKALVGDISYFVDITIVSYAATVDPFTYSTVDMTELGHADPAFLLPYYTDAVDRAIYGEIDLGLVDAWKGATASFSVDGKFEYFNGRIRVLALHDYATAGGNYKNVAAEGLALSAGTMPAARDVNSTGTPVVMTLTAKDGTEKRFNLWSFETALRAEEATADTYQYVAGSESNSIIRVESVKNGAEEFVPMHRDSAYTNLTSMSSFVGSMYTHGNLSYNDKAVVPILNSGGQMILPTYYWPDGRQWKTHLSNGDFPDLRGISFTFTAPYSGTIQLSAFAPKNNYALSSSMGGFTSYLSANGSYAAKAIVRAYNADGTYTTLYEEKWGNKANTSPFSLMGDPVVADSATLENAGDDQTLTFDVQKGQDIRVILMVNEKLYTNNNMPLELGSASPAPVFAYQKAQLDEFDGDYAIYATPSSFEGVTSDGILTLLYDENGVLLDTLCGAEVYAEEDYVSISLEGLSISPAYAKLFFWNTMDNIAPLAESLIIRK